VQVVRRNTRPAGATVVPVSRYARKFENAATMTTVRKHSWQPGDLLMWDNAAVQHRATFDYDLPLRRLMYRTTVRGSTPF
jgi:alpha-ketoglutarate-dependent taurine dioxygenase